MSDPDIAALLFPADAPTAPTAPAQVVQQADKADAAAILFPSDKPAPAPAAGRSDDPVSEAFPTEAAPDPAAAVAETFDTWAAGLRRDGHADRANEMRAVGEVLAEEFRQTGMSDADTQEVMGLAQEAMGNAIMPGVPVSEDRLVEMRAEAEAYIAENAISAQDIGLAQRLVRDLDAKTGGKVSAYLIDTGMGNAPPRNSARRGNCQAAVSLMLDAGNGLRCPCCSGGAADLAALDSTIWDLIRWRGLSEEAESVLRAIWAGAGLPVTAELIWDEMYRWDIEGGPSQARCYADLNAAVAELAMKLLGTGLQVTRHGREGYRLSMQADGAYVAA